MNGEALQRERELFEAALALPRADRESWLREACGDDETLCTRIERLIRQADGDAPTPAMSVALTDAAACAEETPGTAIGPYELVELLGEGGFGSVYLAEQREPVQRRVALKIIKLGMDTRHVIARFEVERQALAMMDHPGIARVIDAGTTIAGRPYFVMDAVEGVPITDFCDEHGLSTTARLRLFAKVCAAVQHAHQKGIIHRDLKPSNVLVTMRDDGPDPKVIDFGIAKATGPPLTARTLHTNAQELVGTPEYMSPEQASLGAVDVDTRSDIYSLGVLLYELLTGTPPFDHDRLRSATLSEMQRMILEEMPPRPSAHARVLRGDLDRIITKAIAKEPAHRYGTAEALAEDIRRFLADEPVLAAPPGAWYRARKFARRNRTAVIAALLIATALVAGATLATIGFAWAQHERDVATERLRASYIAQAQAARSSTRIGRRAESLDVLGRAAAIRPSRELRDEVIACLTLDDLVAETTIAVPDGGSAHADGLRTIDRLAIALDSGRVRVVRTADGEVVLEIEAATPNPVVLVFSPDGRFLAVKYHTHDDIRLHVWEVEERRRILTLDDGVFARNGIAFAGDSRWVALTQADDAVHVYRLPDGAHERTIEIDGEPWYLAADPAGARLAVSRLGEGSYLRVVDVDTGTELLGLDTPAAVRAPIWSPDGRYVAGGGTDNHVYVWDAATGDRRPRLVGHQGAPIRLHFDRSGEVLASYGWDGTTRLWDVATGAPLLEPIRYQKAIGFGARLATVSREDASVTFWRYDRSRAVRRMSGSAPFGVSSWMEVDPDGRWLVTAAVTGVRLWDLRDETEYLVLTDERAEGALLVSQPRSIIATVRKTGLVRWSLQTTGAGVEVSEPEVLWPHAGLGRACMSPDGRRVLVYDAPGITVFDLGERRPVRVIESDGLLATTPSVSPDGRWMGTGTWQGRAGHVWDLETGVPVQTFEGSHVVCTFAPGAPLLAVSFRHEYRFLEVGTWSLRFRVRRAHETSAGPVAFSPDGRMTAIATSPGNIAILDCSTGAVLATLPTPDGKRVIAMKMTPGSPRLLACTPDYDVHVWDLAVIRDRLRTLDLDWE